MKIMINADLSDDQLKKIKDVSDELEVVVAGSRDDQIALIPDAEIVLGGMNRKLFLEAKKLKWLQVPSAGADSLLFPEFVESDVTLTSMKGYVGVHLADHAMA